MRTRPSSPSATKCSTPRAGRPERRAALKELAYRVACAAAIPALARRAMPGRLAILMFHGVEAEPLIPRCDYVLDVTTLRRDLAYIRRCFHVLPLEEGLERLRAGTLPDRAVALTFDDGTHNLATHAAPVLRELGLPAAVFLATGPMGTGEALWPDRLWLAFARTRVPNVDLTAIGLGRRSLGGATDRGEAWGAATERLKGLPDSERIARVESLVADLGQEFDAQGSPFEMLSWDEARALARDGLVTLYPHSVTHPILSRCPDQKVEYEVSESCAALQREIGCAPTIFAYPNGGEEDFDDRAKAAVRRNDMRWALSTIGGSAHRYSDPLALPRIGIGGNLSYACFRLHVSGALPLRHFKPWRRPRPRVEGMC